MNRITFSPPEFPHTVNKPHMNGAEAIRAEDHLSNPSLLRVKLALTYVVLKLSRPLVVPMI
jgi:hypothetical protein